jgi:hypothetical protein
VGKLLSITARMGSVVGKGRIEWRGFSTEKKSRGLSRHSWVSFLRSRTPGRAKFNMQQDLIRRRGAGRRQGKKKGRWLGCGAMLVASTRLGLGTGPAAMWESSVVRANASRHGACHPHRASLPLPNPAKTAPTSGELQRSAVGSTVLTLDRPHFAG